MNSRTEFGIVYRVICMEELSIITRQEAGIAFENSYFDTYREQPDAHRAWCDEEANVGVYFKLKELGVCSDGL